MLAKKLDHVLLAELLERGQRDTGKVEKIVLFSIRIWNCTKYSERTAGVAAAVITYRVFFLTGPNLNLLSVGR